MSLEESPSFDAVQNVQNWLVTSGRNCRTMGTMLHDFALELRRNGIPMDRVYLGTTVIHPQASAWVWKWESSSPHQVTEIPIKKEIFDRRLEIAGRDAPMNHLEANGLLRIRASDEAIPKASQNLFRERGYVDMYGLQIEMYDNYGGGITYATKNVDGFLPQHIAFLDKIHPTFSCLVQLHLRDLCMHSLLCTYLGKDPGNRVHRGSILRGEGRTVRSVVWFSDIRGFTKMSSMLGRDTVIGIINAVFEATDKALTDHGGEVLKFMGDGVMAVFTAQDDAFTSSETKKEEESDRSSICDNATADLCCHARMAAVRLQTDLAKMRKDRTEQGLPGSDVHVGIGLHYGDVSYGNIGAPSRLDFTVIGPSVNLASRVESLCGKLGVPVLATEEFVKRDEDPGAWVSNGNHQLKGFVDPVDVYELNSSSEGAVSSVEE